MSQGTVVEAVAIPQKRRLRMRLRRLDGKVSPYLYISPFFLLFAVFGLFPLLYTALGLAHRPQPPRPGHPLRRARQLHRAPPRRLLLERGQEHAGNLPDRDGAAALPRARPRARAEHEAPRAHALPHGRAAAADHVARRGCADLHAALLARLRLDQLRPRRLGIGKVDWEAGDYTSWIALSVMVIWRWTGYNALIYLAAMQAIPDDLYEAAASTARGRGGSSGTSRSRSCGPRSSSPSSSPRSAGCSSSPSHTCSSPTTTARPAARSVSTRPSSCTSTRSRSGRASSSSVTRPRSDGRCSC